ncbi:MAG: hypothetical protein J6Z26_01730 [Bacteroidales bacterium]|nr:hypothetical protein [Bacteroidales bacterium]
MKKAILLFCMAMSLFATNAFAQMQEVRGVETRRVIYDGPRYEKCSDCNYSTKYYGFEFHNSNSIKVSVDIEIYRQEDGKEILVATKSITLKPNETYTYKQENDYAYRKDAIWQNYSAGSFIVKYKAYKLQ